MDDIKIIVNGINDIQKEGGKQDAGSTTAVEEKIASMIEKFDSIEDSAISEKYSPLFGLLQLELGKNLISKNDLPAAFEGLRTARKHLDVRAFKKDDSFETKYVLDSKNLQFPGHVQDLYRMMGLCFLVQERFEQAVRMFYSSIIVYLSIRDSNDVVCVVPELQVSPSTRTRNLSLSLHALSHIYLVSTPVNREEMSVDDAKTHALKVAKYSYAGMCYTIQSQHEYKSELSKRSLERIENENENNNESSLSPSSTNMPEKMFFSIPEWITRAIQLSGLFLECDRFDLAQSCIAASQRVWEDYGLEFVRYGKERIEGDIFRAWGKFFLACIVFSRVKETDKEKNSEEGSDTKQIEEETMKDDEFAHHEKIIEDALDYLSFEDDCARMFPPLLTKEAGQEGEEGNSISPLSPFEYSLPLTSSSSVEKMVEEGVEFFEKACKLFTIEKFCSDYSNICVDISSCYKQLCGMIEIEYDALNSSESNPTDAEIEVADRLIHNHGKRTSRLEFILAYYQQRPVMKHELLKKRFEERVSDERLIYWELGSIYNDLSTWILKKFPMATRNNIEVGVGNDSASATKEKFPSSDKLFREFTMYIMKSISRYSGFLKTFHDVEKSSNRQKGNARVIFEDCVFRNPSNGNDVHMLLMAHFNIARLYQKLSAGSGDLRNKVRNLESSMAHYAFVEKACEDFEICKKVFEKQLGVVSQIHSFIPIRLEALQAEIGIERVDLLTSIPRDELKERFKKESRRTK